MTSGDWIALGAAIVAIVACVVSVITYRLQKRTQATSDEEQLNGLIESIQGGLANLKWSGPAMTIDAYAANGVTLGTLRGQALEARKLMERADIEPDWFQSVVLAYAFSQAWDPAGAITYWERAVDVSTGPGNFQAHISSLEARGTFYYRRGRDGDLAKARDDFKTALRELRKDPEQQGPDLVAQQAAGLLLSRASFELDIGAEAKTMVGLVTEAFTTGNAIAAPWRRLETLKFVGTLALALQQRGLPELLAEVAAELSRQGAEPDGFPTDTAALLSLPPDGSLFLPADQPGGQPGSKS
jgi:tetratricopeptide (TPR) repeat protein